MSVPPPHASVVEMELGAGRQTGHAHHRSASSSTTTAAEPTVTLCAPARLQLSVGGVGDHSFPLPAPTPSVSASLPVYSRKLAAGGVDSRIAAQHRASTFVGRQQQQQQSATGSATRPAPHTPSRHHAHSAQAHTHAVVANTGADREGLPERQPERQQRLATHPVHHHHHLSDTTGELQLPTDAGEGSGGNGVHDAEPVAGENIGAGSGVIGPGHVSFWRGRCAGLEAKLSDNERKL